METDKLRALPMFERALVYAAMMHAGQKDKGGSPYILHVIRVMERVDTLEEQVVALLHDLLEDTETSEEDLLDVGFDPQIVHIVRLLTRDIQEDYMEYISGLSVSETAIRVKLSDLRDNQDKTRLKRELTPEDLERLIKYRQAEEYLKEILLDKP